jgi:CspA family cold shock protein
MTGTVKWFHDKKGFGFIEADDGDGDVFIHYKDIPGDGFKTLVEGQKLEFDIEENDKGDMAKNVKILSGPPVGVEPKKKVERPAQDKKPLKPVAKTAAPKVEPKKETNKEMKLKALENLVLKFMDEARDIVYS